jgi:hypothetical protein
VRSCRSRFPLLPLEEEGRLNDMPLRENFIERVFVCRKGATGPTGTGRAQWLGTTPRWAASSQTRASGTGTN